MSKRPIWFNCCVAGFVSFVVFSSVLADDANKDAPNEQETKEPATNNGEAKQDGAAEKDGEARKADAAEQDGEAKKDAEASKDREDEKRPAPHPDLTPGEVVRIVIDALKDNDERDRGIAITFDFASPANQELTGPLERFVPMVKGPAYAPMLKHKSAKYGKVLVRQDQAQQLVTIVDADGNEAAYVFQLSKQTEGGREGCWMTDGVIRVEPGTEPEEPKLDVPDDGNSAPA